MRFKYGITFSVIILIFMLAGYSMVQLNKEAKSPNSQSSGSINAEKPPSSNSKTSIPSNTTSESSFTSIHMVDAMTGWASTKEYILRTDDGGENWTDITPKGIVDQVTGQIFCQDGQTAWITFTQESSPKIIIYRTKDGGQNWKNVEISRTYSTHITSLSFSDSTHGWLLASDGGAAGSEWVDVFKTSDGGASWKQAASANPKQEIPNGIPFSGDKTGLVFANQKDGWITGGSPGPSVWLYTTHDGGQTWASQSLPIPKGYHTGGGAAGTKSPYFFGSKDGVLPVVFQGQEPPALMLYTSHDGGISWYATTPAESSQESLASYRGFQWSIIDAQHSIVSDGYKLYYTFDGMQSFVAISPNIDLKNLQQLDFVSEQLGWAIIDGDLWKTSDGGHVWTEVNWISTLTIKIGSNSYEVSCPLGKERYFNALSTSKGIVWNPVPSTEGENLDLHPTSPYTFIFKPKHSNEIGYESCPKNFRITVANG